MSIRGSQARRTGRRPRRGAGDVALLLWRGKWLMFAVFAAVFLAGSAMILSSPQPMEARTRLIVTAPDDADIAREMEFFRSDAVRRRIAGRLSVERLFPALHAECRTALQQTAGEAARERLEQRCLDEAANQMQFLLRVEADTGATFSARVRHTNPQAAVELLNALSGAYLAYRAEQLDVPDDNPVRLRRRDLETALEQVEADLAALAGQTGSDNPESDIVDTRKVLTAARAEFVRNRSRAAEVTAEVRAYRERLAGLEPEQFAFIEDTSARTLMQLQAAREEAVAGYGADAQEVRELDQQIAQAEAYLASRGGMVGTARREPNPVYQQTQIALARAEAEAGATEQQRRDLQRRISTLEARLSDLSGVLPQYQQLSLERRIAEQALVDIAGEEIARDAAVEAARGRIPVVTVLQPAEIIHAGGGDRAMRLLVCAALAALLALLAGLLRALLTIGFATPGMIERSVRVPVLAVVRRFG